ncbi:MAG: Ig-like domain-containing protein, partial [Gemmatimonadota bacterium]|nr:Ig-like domain-containing protein [Gemmatimonadota bacterium]
MRLKRFALVAGVLALGAAACGDDVQVVEPTPPQPPPPPPLTATMTPLSHTVQVGSTVTFAVGTSGGVVGESASWTCASSNTGIATVSVTGAGCQATGVAAGEVTITATVTKGSENTNVGAALTVTADAPPDAGDPAFILISDIEGGGGPGASALSGHVDVEVSVERGDATLEQLSVLVDGEVVASQSFGTSMGMTPEAEDAAAEQAVHEFTFSFDSGAYELHGDHIDVEYMNGEHTIAAELQVAGGMMADGMMGHETISSNVITVEFNNPDGFVVEADLGDNSALGADGKRWYGGPANGHIAISALPVIYSGEEIGEVTISLAGCEVDEEGDGDDHGNGGDDHGHAAEASFEFDCEGEDAGRAIKVFVGGVESENILNKLPVANIDMKGPAVAPYFDPNPNNRELGWVNLTVDFLGEQGPGSKKDGWLTYNKTDDEPGVGGYQPVLRYAKAGNTGLKDAIAAAPLSLTNLPGESALNHYCAVVSAVDNLGNESSLPDPDEDNAGCVLAGVPAVIAEDGTVTTPATADSYEALLRALVVAKAATPVDDDVVEAAEAALANAGILVGVDITPPGIEIDDDERINALADIGFGIDVYDDEHADHNSDIHSVPLHVSIERRAASDTEGLDTQDDAGTGTDREVNSAEDVDCDKPIGLPDDDGDIPITFAADPAASNAYYTVSGRSRDKAGNYSAMASHTFVFDTGSPATATAPAAPGSIDAGEVFQIASFLNDDLSIRDYYVTANFAGDIALGIVSPTVVDAFDAEPLTHRNHTVTVDVETYAGITTDPSTASTATTGVTIAVRDQAQQSDTPADRHTAVTATLTVGAPGASDDFTDNFSAALSAIDAVCVAEKESDCAEANRESETELEVEATADATGAFSEPFERVDFWMQD